MNEDKDNATSAQPGIICFSGQTLTTQTMKIYRCAAGNETEIHGDWWALSVVNSNGTHNYQFCFQCWGEWAQKQWPLTCEEVR